MSKDDFVTLYVAQGNNTTATALSVRATKAGRTVRVSQSRTDIGWTVAQELSRRKVIHEVKARTKDIVGLEKWFRNGSAS